MDPVYRDVARNFSTGTKHLYTLVMLPAISPALVDGMRLSVGLALLGTVTVEFLVGESGLGHLIWNSWTVLSLTQSMAGLIVAALLGSLAYGSLAILGEDRNSVAMTRLICSPCRVLTSVSEFGTKPTIQDVR